MQKKTTEAGKKDEQQPKVPPEDRRGVDRRKAKGDGYTYIPMVGWYCRRAESRRDDDDGDIK
jgi:hypothetical protein